MSQAVAEKPSVRAIIDGLKRAESFEVQTLLLSKERFTREEADKWVTDNGFTIKAGAPDETENEYRYRQFEPSQCKKDTFKTFEITDGVQAVGCKVETEEAAPGRYFTEEEIRARFGARDSEQGHELRYVELKYDRSRIDPEARTVPARATLLGVDRHGTLIMPAGFRTRLERFLSNPVLLWAHNHFAPPIGAVDNLEIAEESVDFIARFASTPFADEIFQLYKDGFLRAFSIGFYPLKVRRPTEEEVKKYGEELWAVIEEIELLEISAVPIGSNVGALVLNAAPGTSAEDGARSWFKAQEDTLEWVRNVRIAQAANGALSVRKKGEDDEDKPGKKPQWKVDPEAVKEALVAVAEHYNALGEAIKAVIAAVEEKPGEGPDDEPAGNLAEKPESQSGGEAKSLSDAIDGVRDALATFRSQVGSKT